MATKKFLVPFDPQNPDRIIKDFIIPDFDVERHRFIEIDTDRNWDFGMVVYVGKEIVVSDIFARLIKAKKKVVSVSDLEENLEDYLGQISKIKIGTKVYIRTQGERFFITEMGK